MIKCIDKQVLRRFEPNRAPICGAITYISATEPILLRRLGWEIGDDIHDNHFDEISRDNGQTWGERTLAQSVVPVSGGHLVYIEYAVLHHPKLNRLLIVTNERFEGDLSHCNLSANGRLQFTERDLATGKEKTYVSDFGLRQGIMVSFTVPLLDKRGHIVLPIQYQRPVQGDDLGLKRHAGMPDFYENVWQTATLIGAFDAAGELSWRLGRPVPYELATTSRGLLEGTVAELTDGRLAMVLRASNVGWEEKPCHKWQTFSEDGGESWSPATPLRCDDGTLYESGSNGSALFRSLKTGKLYWMGNLCLDGERADGNFPRQPLMMAEVQEEPFALKRDTITVIDRKTPEEDARVQLSNFKFYQDRETGDIVFYLTRYGENGSDGLEYCRRLEGAPNPPRNREWDCVL